MKIKCKKIKVGFSLMSLAILLVLLCDKRFLFLIELPSLLVAGSSNNNLLAVVSLIIFGIWIIGQRKVALGNMGKLIFGLYMIVFLSSVYTYIVFGCKLTKLIWGIIPYMILLSYFPGRKILLNEKNRKFFISAGEILSILYAVLLSIQVLVYNGPNSIFLQFEDMISDKLLIFPERGLRLYNVMDGFSRIFVLIVFNEILDKDIKIRKCKLDIIAFCSLLLGIIAVDQSRFYLMTEFACFAAMLYKKFGCKIKRKHLLFAVGSGVGGAAAIWINAGSMMNSILTNTGSWYARLGACYYYLNVGAKHGIFGLGIASPEEGTQLYSLLHGPEGIYYPDDVGIVGTFACLGILGLIWYLFALYKVVKLYHETSINKTLSLGILVCFVLSLAISSYLDRTRIVSLTMTFIIMEVNWQQTRRENI